MFYVILFIVIGMVLAPIMYLKPSPLQKRRMLLRARAHELGLEAKYAVQPEAKAARGHDSREVANAMSYRLLRRDERPLKVSYQLARTQKGDGWFFIDSAKRPPILWVEQLFSLLADCPQDIAVVESTPLYVAVYWQEQGTEDDVASIAWLLKEIDTQEREFLNQKSAEQGECP